MSRHRATPIAEPRLSKSSPSCPMTMISVASCINSLIACATTRAFDPRILFPPLWLCRHKTGLHRSHIWLPDHHRVPTPECKTCLGLLPRSLIVAPLAAPSHTQCYRNPPTRNALISSRISNLSPIIRPRSWREKTPRYMPSEYFRKNPLNRLHQAIGAGAFRSGLRSLRLVKSLATHLPGYRSGSAPTPHPALPPVPLKADPVCSSGRLLARLRIRRGRNNLRNQGLHVARRSLPT